MRTKGYDEETGYPLEWWEPPEDLRPLKSEAIQPIVTVGVSLLTVAAVLCVTQLCGGVR